MFLDILAPTVASDTHDTRTASFGSACYSCTYLFTFCKLDFSRRSNEFERNCSWNFTTEKDVIFISGKIPTRCSHDVNAVDEIIEMIHKFH